MEELYKKRIDEEEKSFYLKILKENYDWNKIAMETFEIYREIFKLK